MLLRPVGSLFQTWLQRQSGINAWHRPTWITSVGGSRRRARLIAGGKNFIDIVEPSGVEEREVGNSHATEVREPCFVITKIVPEFVARVAAIVGLVVGLARLNPSVDRIRDIDIDLTLLVRFNHGGLLRELPEAGVDGIVLTSCCRKVRVDVPLEVAHVAVVTFRLVRAVVISKGLVAIVDTIVHTAFVPTG